MNQIAADFYVSIFVDASVNEIDTYGSASSRFPEARRTDSDV
jgi:predicted 3-demethylubiquinone-9 3-methyltransferase (glyoxalase superfamily)